LVRLTAEVFRQLISELVLDDFVGVLLQTICENINGLSPESKEAILAGNKSFAYRSFGVVSFAVVPNELNVVKALLSRKIEIVSEVFPHCSDIHRLGNDVEIVGKSES
jgi:hypothetical protein